MGSSSTQSFDKKMMKMAYLLVLSAALLASGCAALPFAIYELPPVDERAHEYLAKLQLDAKILTKSQRGDPNWKEVMAGIQVLQGRLAQLGYRAEQDGETFQFVDGPRGRPKPLTSLPALSREAILLISDPIFCPHLASMGEGWSIQQRKEKELLTLGYRAVHDDGHWVFSWKEVRKRKGSN